MFYYFGRKKRLAGQYPTPTYSSIVEPFAGSAAYSLHSDNWRRDVWINEIDPRIVALWRWLQGATVADVERLPAFAPGERISSVVSLTDEERLLISLHAGPGKNRNNDVVSRFSRWEPGRRYIAANLHKIRHWRITEGSYAEMANQEATWFCDPPYQRSGRLYAYQIADFAELGAWCKDREGQVIVCEQDGANWLPFEPLTSQQNGRFLAHEWIYSQPAIDDSLF